MNRPGLGVLASLIALALLGFFQFPGHTWLQQDTQIYIPIFERLWDPTALPNDLVASKPHVSFTIYDETAIALRWITRTSFEIVLESEQFIFRVLQLAGVYLLARALGLGRHPSIAVAAFFGLGATVIGPAVLTFEYEPTPRAFALGLLFLAVGLMVRGYPIVAGHASAGAISSEPNKPTRGSAADQGVRPTLAGCAAGIAFLYHPPTAIPVWIVFILIALHRRDYRLLIPLAGAAVTLALAAHFQTGTTEPQPIFDRIDPGWEKLERFRASYNWVGMWVDPLIWQYLFFWALTLIAVWRVGRKCCQWFTLGLPLIGILSVPVSYVLTERLKWALMPQVQPARALLWVTAFAAILSAAAGIRAAERRIWWEALLWLTVVFAIPMQARIFEITGVRLLLAIGLAVVACAAVAVKGHRFAKPALALAIATPYFAIPVLGGVVNYPRLHTPELTQLADYARANTPQNAMFLFPDAGQAVYPGLFRADAIRDVYVDWKAGGQVNYFRSLAEDWWTRWQATMSGRDIAGNLPRFRALGIDYIVLKRTNAIWGINGVYANDGYIVYRLDR